MNNSKKYSQYVREQLTTEQNNRLDLLEKSLGQMHFDDKGIGEIIGDASDIHKRISIEIPFIIKEAKLNCNSRMFDACVGTGSTSIGLKKHGLENVVSNDIDDELISYSIRKSKEVGTDLSIISYDWRDIPDSYKDSFDAICCLGNSLTYLFGEEARQVSVQNFSKILVPGGKLIIDTRNYTELLRGNFLNTDRGPYRGMKNLKIVPEYISSDMILFRYNHLGIKHDLLLYPLKDGEMERLIINAGFADIHMYGDYNESYNSKEAEFYTFIATKK